MNDQTQEIALAKGGGKVRRPIMVICNACGGRYFPEDKENHLAYDCAPSPYRITDKTADLIPRRPRRSKRRAAPNLKGGK